MNLKLPLEMGGCEVAAGNGDLCHGIVGLREETTGTGDAQLIDILRQGPSCALPEQAAEAAFAQARHGGKFGQVNLFREMLLDVVADPANAICAAIAHQ